MINKFCRCLHTEAEHRKSGCTKNAEYKWHCKCKKFDEKIILTCGSFGFLVPSKSGVLWNQQADGVMCNQIYLEGVFIPLPRPIDEKFDRRRKGMLHGEYFQKGDLIEMIADANYKILMRKAKEKRLKEIWKHVKEIMSFDFEPLTFSEIYKYKNLFYNGRTEPTQEAFMWIRLKKLDKNKWFPAEMQSLVGKEMVLIYENSD